MKKEILTIGKALSRKEQKLVHGGMDVGFFDLGTCTASCTHGDDVTCSGSNCHATTDIGCTAGSGNNLDEKDCPTKGGLDFIL